MAVLAWLLRDVDGARLAAIAAEADWRWMALAFVLKLGSLLLHEIRTWVPLPRPRPPLAPVVRLCLGVGLLNLVLPARAGDLGIIAALNRRFGVPVGTATAVVAVSAFIEAAVFGGFLVGTLLVGAADGGSLSVAGAPTVPWLLIGGAAVASLAGLAAAVALGRWRATRPRPPGLAGVLHATLVDTARLLTSPAAVGANTALALAQVGLMVSAFSSGLPAVGIHGRAPLTTASEVLALSSLASLLLPPSWGVGPAAASRLVLVAAGHSPEQALVYAGAWWLIAHLPFLAIGLPALWWPAGRQR